MPFCPPIVRSGPSGASRGTATATELWFSPTEPTRRAAPASLNSRLGFGPARAIRVEYRYIRLVLEVMPTRQSSQELPTARTVSSGRAIARATWSPSIRRSPRTTDSQPDEEREYAHEIHCTTRAPSIAVRTDRTRRAGGNRRSLNNG